MANIFNVIRGKVETTRKLLHALNEEERLNEERRYELRKEIVKATKELDDLLITQKQLGLIEDDV